MERIVVNNRIRHGKPIIEGTRITVEEVLGMLESGMSYEEIEEEYGLTKIQILSVIKYLASFIKGENVQKISA